MLPVAVLAAILRVETVALLFGGFAPATITLTADTFLAFLPGLPAHALIAVLARAFYARQDTLTPVLAAVGAVIINTTLAALLVGPLGLPGIALAIAIAAWLEAGALTVLLRRREGSLGLGTVASVALRTLIAGVVGGAAAVAVYGVLAPTLAPDPASLGRAGIPGIAAMIVLVSIVFSAVFATAALALRIGELRSIVAIMVDAIGRPHRS
jgi:putative peptidoglycan lipid II flippase